MSNIFDPLKYNDLFDSHCHLFDEKFDVSRADVVTDAISHGVRKIVDVGIDLSSSVKALKNAETYPEIVYPTIGLHPECLVPGSDLYFEYADEHWIDERIAEFHIQLKQYPGKYVMIGECGMDLYWLIQNNADNIVYEKSKRLQQYLLIKHIELAIEYELPLTIHHRDSLTECLEIIAPYSGKVRAIFHSFTGDYIAAKTILDEGFNIGINGIVTYKNAEELRTAVRKIAPDAKHPADFYAKGIFLETDAPYLPPQGYRGQINRPQYLSDVIKSLVV